MTEVAVPENPVAQLSAYELRHLAEHLELAERADDLHRLLGLVRSVALRQMVYQSTRKARASATLGSSGAASSVARVADSVPSSGGDSGSRRDRPRGGSGYAAGTSVGGAAAP
jgi:hypothetical protein